MSRVITRSALIVMLAATAVGTSGCLATAVGAAAGTAVGVTAAVVGTTAKVGAKVVGATARAVIPGNSKKDN
jgi:hypothetical protein